MLKFCKRKPLFAVFATIILSTNANSQAPSNASATTTLGVTVTLPKPYESTISSLGALAASGGAALKTYRSDARALAIRSALSAKLLSAGPLIASISLDKSDTDPKLGEIAILCNPRQSFVLNSVSLSYVNTLVQNIKTVSVTPPAPTDILGALKLLFASSSYAIADGVQVGDADIKRLGDATLANCQSDLQAYEGVYYGMEIKAPGAAAKAVAPAAPAGITTFVFLGPIGTLIDTFLSTLQPVLIDASQIVDQTKRQTAIVTALSNHDIRGKIERNGRQLATAVDDFAIASRRILVGSFVEQLVSLRQMPIDLSGVPDCKTLSPETRLPSGAPNAAFIECWRAAWAKLQPQVASLNTTADNYDTLSDAGAVSARKLLGTILADYNQISSAATDPKNLAIFAGDVTQFITFATAVANAASTSNISGLKSAAEKISK